MLHQIGVGALGPVFRTYEPSRDRLVAVKVFRLDITPEQSQSLADALATAAEAGLFHPSIVEPIAAGLEGTLAYRAEEYVAAESLDVAMRHYAPAPAHKVLPFITQLAGAIDFARAAGIGHGALHPRDVFLTPDEARATGFGVVEALERVGLRAPVRRPYSAPERVDGQSWGTPADVFSLAVIAYEMLTGRRPAGTGSQIGAFDTPRGNALHAVLVKAMADDPAKRFRTALAFAAAMEAASRDESVPADDVEDAVAVMPPLIDVDPKEEPVQAEQEEAAFRAEEPLFDDIAAEREDDDAHRMFAGGQAEKDTGGEDDEDGFDAEPIDDLELDASGADAASLDRFAGEFEFIADDADDADEADDTDDIEDTDEAKHADDPFEYVSHERTVSGERLAMDDENDDTEEGDVAMAAPVVAERSRPPMLPLALGAIVLLAIGYTAGYVRGRETAVPAPQAAAPQGPAPAAPAAQAPATAADSGKAYSEQAVAPPARPSAPSSTTPTAGTSRATATRGRLVVQSTPAGAGVTVNGRWRGRTPLTLENLPLRPYAIRVVQPGYALARQDVTLSADTASRTVSFRLQRTRPAPAPERPAAPSGLGSLYVDSRPRGARVFVDGKASGTTPVLVPGLSSGAHSVRLELADHRNWTTTTTVRVGQQNRVTGSLDRIQ